MIINIKLLLTILALNNNHVVTGFTIHPNYYSSSAATLSSTTQQRRTNTQLFYANDDDDILIPVPNGASFPTTTTTTKRRTKTATTATTSIKPLTKFDIAWNEQYKQLQTFHRQHGHSDVPYSYTDKRLVRWVTNQRQNRKSQKTSMTLERIDKLNALNFTWETRNIATTTTTTTTKRRRSTSTSSKGQQQDWYTRYQELNQFYETHGQQTIVSSTQNPKLWRWIDTQRTGYRLYQKKRKTSLTQDRINLLNDIGFIWDPVQTRWIKRLEEYKTYISMQQQQQQRERGKGEDDVDAKLGEENPQLSSWIKNQRQQYKLYINGEKSSLTTERIASLNEIGFDWKLSLHSTTTTSNSMTHKNKSNTTILKKIPWKVMFQQLEEYKQIYGHCCVPQHYKANAKLGTFVKAQRRQYKLLKEGKKSSMTKERLTLLNSIDFVWSVSGSSSSNHHNSYSLEQMERYEKLSLLLQQRRNNGNVGGSSSRWGGRIVRRNDIDFNTEIDSEQLLAAYEKRTLWGAVSP